MFGELLMEFIERLRQLSAKVKNLGPSIKTEEATKNAFIMPFISQVLGYDVFDPNEVVPEFVCDIGTKKGEKIDYAIMKDGDISILIECKKIGEPLNTNNASQLFRYFHATNARIAILTNGQFFRFYTDLDAPNKMDEKPFLEMDMLRVDETIVAELSKITKNQFDINSIINAAEEMKYVSQIKAVIRGQFQSPGDDYIRLMVSKVYEGKFTEKIRDQFTDLTKKALTQFVNDQLNERLKSAIVEPEPPSISVDIIEAEKGAIETTQEELEAFQIVRAIVREAIDVKRVTYRDNQSYFGIFVDDNNRKPICRMHLNRNQKYIGIFDENKAEARILIETLDDIFKHSSNLQKTALLYVDANK